jgi:hypothetical protein
MLRAMVGEWQFSNRFIRITSEGLPHTEIGKDLSHLEYLSWLIQIPFVQPQDSSNRSAELILKAVETFEVPFPQYPLAIENFQPFLEEAQKTSQSFNLYNPYGKALFGMGALFFQDYQVRVTDLEGLRQLSLATAELRSQSISPEGVTKALEKSPYKNPYSGKPFSWDEANKSVVFQGLQEGDCGRHSLLY